MQAFATCKIFLWRFISLVVVVFSPWCFFRFFAFLNVFVTKQFFLIFPSNFPHFCLCLFVHCFVVSLRCPVCLTLQILRVHSLCNNSRLCLCFFLISAFCVFNRFWRRHLLVLLTKLRWRKFFMLCKHKVICRWGKKNCTKHAQSALFLTE